MDKKIFAKYLPATLLCLFILIALITTFQQAKFYSVMTVDEQIQNVYGDYSLAWYKTHGQDQRFLTNFNPKAYMPEHGPVIETIISEAQYKFGHPLHTRALIVGLIGFAGVLAMALCGFEMAGWWGALLAALGLWLYPRFVGTMFSNSKDVPFTSCMIFVLWSVLLLVRQWRGRWRYLINSCLVGFLLGFIISIRVNGILWLPMLGCLPVVWWLCYGRDAFKQKTVVKNLIKQVIAACIILTVTFLVMIICWPYIALDPLHNLYNAIVVNSKYPWNGVIKFDGVPYQAAELPRSYIPTWLVIGSPPAIVFLAIAGTLMLGWKLIKRRTIELPIAVIALSIFFPLIALIALHPVLYNAMRQFLFLTPPLILLAVYGFVTLFNYLKQRKQKVIASALVLIVVIGQLLVIKDMADLYPYQYIYFSPLVGGLAGAKGNYEVEYETLCMKPTADWLVNNYKQYTPNAHPFIATSVGSGIITPYYPDILKAGDNKANPDFYIETDEYSLKKNYPTYKLIHTITVEGYAVCKISTKP